LLPFNVKIGTSVLVWFWFYEIHHNLTPN